jgi:hypothetical protein
MFGHNKVHYCLKKRFNAFKHWHSWYFKIQVTCYKRFYFSCFFAYKRFYFSILRSVNALSATKFWSLFIACIVQPSRFPANVMKIMRSVQKNYGASLTSKWRLLFVSLCIANSRKEIPAYNESYLSVLLYRTIAADTNQISIPAAKLYSYLFLWSFNVPLQIRSKSHVLV